MSDPARRPEDRPVTQPVDPSAGPTRRRSGLTWVLVVIAVIIVALLAWWAWAIWLAPEAEFEQTLDHVRMLQRSV